jgi:hypothetical protein
MMEHNITMDGLTVFVNLDDGTFKIKDFNVKGRVVAGSPDPATKNSNGDFTVPFRLVDWKSAVQEWNRAKAVSYDPIIAEQKLHIQSAKQLILQEFPGRPPLKVGFLRSLTLPPHYAEQAVVEEALAELIAEKTIFENEGYLFLKT